MNPEHDSNPRQTLSYIRDLLLSRGISPKSKMGQNFLIDLNLLDLILATAELTRADSVLEVGTGTGSLTSRLTEDAGGVLTVELDYDFFELASDLLRSRPNLVLTHADILARKNVLNPEVLTKWDRVTESHLCTQRKLIANLPYVVATPVIANLLISEIVVERMVVMVQWEMAERLSADPGSKSYGALAVLVQNLADVQVVRRLGPKVFWPRPDVDSAIICIRPNAEKRKRVGNVPRFRAFLRDLYTQRRKNLRQALSGWPSGHRDKKIVDAKLEALGFSGTDRAETLSLEQHLRLSEAFQDMIVDTESTETETTETE